MTTIDPLTMLHGERVLVTGAAGSIGAAVTARLAAAEIAVVPTDIDTLDVRYRVLPTSDAFAPTLIIHCAAAKHAPGGETDPRSALETNAVGTANIVELAAARGARVILASTCKAADPETVYGASKLIAERLVLNAGGSVARLCNVRESSGNVFRIWEELAPGAPLPVTPCSRYFISLDQAVDLLLWATVLEPGRYIADPGRPQTMTAIAAAEYPGRPMLLTLPRRGDRIAEPLHAASERVEPTGIDGIIRIISAHDASESFRLLEMAS